MGSEEAIEVLEKRGEREMEALNKREREGKRRVRWRGKNF